MKIRLLGGTLSALSVIGFAVGMPAASAAVPAAGSFNSQPGDYIGQGKPLTVADFTVRKYATDGIQLWSPGTGWNISINFKDQKPTVGMYQTRRSDGPVLMDIGGDGRGCNTSNGTLWIDDLSIGPDGDPDRIAIRVEQHCEGKAAAFFGSVVSVGATAQPIQPPAAPPVAPPIPTIPGDAAPVVVPPTPAANQAATSRTDAIPADPTPKLGLPVGSCAYLKYLKYGEKLIAESCKKPHRFEVVGSWRNAFAGNYSDVERRDEICRQAFIPYVGTYTYETTYRVMTSYPSTQSWQAGDRSLVCIAGVYDGRLKPGTIKGSKR
jgi:Septum formation